MKDSEKSQGLRDESSRTSQRRTGNRAYRSIFFSSYHTPPPLFTRDFTLLCLVTLGYFFSFFFFFPTLPFYIKHSGGREADVGFLIGISSLGTINALLRNLIPLCAPDSIRCSRGHKTRGAVPGIASNKLPR